MRLPMAFDPIEAGEIDNFAFDFTADVGSARIVSTTWTCALAPFQTATDSTPQARILETASATMIQLRSPRDGLLQTKSGVFSVATIGGMPASAVGATYILEAAVTLSDGRVLKLNSTVLCAPPGV
jgi:hypothetical protein